MSDMHRPIVPKSPSLRVSTIPQPNEPLPLKLEVQVVRPLDWIRRFFAANPFYLASVVLLLYGIYRVTCDTGFIVVEVHQLLFNFTALQVYEIALVGLAVWLARRCVWYDATLLVFLENLILIVPFLLVTQGLLIHPTWIWCLYAVGVGMALIRAGTLKRFLRELNLPWRSLAVGGVLLIANTVLPIVYRELQEERVAKNPTWGPAFAMNEWSWFAILPLLVACANLLSAPRATGALWPQRRWLPSVLCATWILGSGVHLYALSYVYTFQLRAAHWAPVLVVLTWTVLRRLTDFVERPAAWARTMLLVVPFPLAFLALASRDTDVSLALFALNAVLYGWTARRAEHPKLAMQLALASGVAALACVPFTWNRPVILEPVPASGFVEGIVLYLLLVSLLSRRPELGLIGATTAGVALAHLPGAWGDFHSAFHGALMFLLLHSLRWDDSRVSGAGVIRWVAASIWVLHAFIWVATGGPFGLPAVVGTGVLLTWGLVFWRRGERPPIAVALAAGVVALSGPIAQTVRWVLAAPVGPLAVATSFALLGVGTVAALTKHRWHRVPED